MCDSRYTHSRNQHSEINWTPHNTLIISLLKTLFPSLGLSNYKWRIVCIKPGVLYFSLFCVSMLCPVLSNQLILFSGVLKHFILHSTNLLILCFLIHWASYLAFHNHTKHLILFLPWHETSYLVFWLCQAFYLSSLVFPSILSMSSHHVV